VVNLAEYEVVHKQHHSNVEGFGTLRTESQCGFDGNVIRALKLATEEARVLVKNISSILASHTPLSGERFAVSGESSKSSFVLKRESRCRVSIYIRIVSKDLLEPS
jgi:hypothetical protein